MKTRLARLLRRVRDRAGRERVRVVRTLRRHAPPALVRPRVSIIVPVYNVEAYIAACLDSLIAQTLPDIEIILVDDCSPDSSMEIAAGYAAVDRRIKIIRQPRNSGLSAARNAGVAKARGDYLCFVDSDDVLAPDACAATVQQLDRSGSDFAVFGYYRFNSTRRWSAAPWITQIHQRRQVGIRAADYPDVIANTISCAKLYRQKFWHRHELKFPVGVKYEDQPVLAKAYAVADAIDVLDRTFLGWRAREDGSSISQQLGTADDLRHRLAAAEAALDHYLQYGTEDLASHRLSQLLGNDFTFAIAAVGRGDDEYWDLLTAGLHRMFTIARTSESGGDDDWIWAAIPPQHRIGYELVLRGERDQVVEFFDGGGGNLANSPTEIVDGRLYARLPHYDDQDSPIPRSRFELLPRQRKLVTAVRRLWWSDAETLTIEGWAYVNNVDHARYPVRLTAALVDLGTGERIELAVDPRPDPEVSRISKQRWCDYESAGFRIDLRTSAALIGDRRRSAWQLELTAEAAGLTAVGRLAGCAQGGSASYPFSRLIEDRIRLTPRFTARNLEIGLSQPPLVLSAISQDGPRTELSVTGRGYRTLRLTHRSAGEVVEVALRRDADHQLSASFTLPELAEDDRPEAWLVRAVKSSGTASPIVWPESVPVPVHDGVGPRTFRTRACNLGVDLAETMIEIVDLEVDEDPETGRPQLTVTSDVTGRAVPAARFELAGAATTVAGTVELQPGRSSVRLPLTADRWGGARLWPEDGLPLPLGRYRLAVTGGAEDRIQVDLGRELVSRLPQNVLGDKLHLRVERTPRNQLMLVVVRPLALTERGARQQRQLQDWHAALEPTVTPRVALFRSYYGENTACNAGATHAELRRRDSDIQVHWTVTDHSVPVPEGGIPVIFESREYYRLLRTAEFVMDNTHQPIYHVKSPGQKVIETFHGYPFKVMGHAHWENLGLSRVRIETFDRRAAEWDYLVSPARYATPLLRRDFRYDGEVLEIGYPRNDVLLTPGTGPRRDAVRSVLGVADGQTAVLYAPTFRDYLSTNDTSAEAVRFIEVDQLTESLGDDFVLLVRGHAFNARAGSRFSGDRVIDVSDYPDVADLYLASDAAIVDYSSLRFDYALTGKPMIFLVPDLERYVETRGWLFDFEPTAPGPFVGSTEETAAALRRLDEVAVEHREAYQKFRETYLDLDDGHAAARLVEAVFEQKSDTSAREIALTQLP
ncbi:bifunctional glycosyltransferase/CDP-glycerol:glycerophosphate glycerophosphotransferase [Microlunatus speluncae]|uniref:bifunctional glycosyltransferase/CDP-glycerol:glycerophosphate glycerophosphotransferase n=1 Tax=Microlunatus speluncae TaxID=2594267 RepID=UPI0012660EBE|nr:CDP-glycerol glycerophosphotransferase family protein [Microlunatus speluncae]